MPRERPLRFVWTMDADERFTLAAPTFADAMGPRTAEAIGKPWREIAPRSALDPEGRVANAIASRDTFSGIVLAWPRRQRRPVSVELSGLPIFDRDRTFMGYRGFGVCRDGARAARDARACHSRVEAAPLRPRQQSRRKSRSVRCSPSCRRRRTSCRSASARREAPRADAGRAFGLQRDRRDLARTARRSRTAAPRRARAAAPGPQSRARRRRPTRTRCRAPSRAAISADAAQKNAEAQLAVLERLPVGVLIHRNDALLYANRAFLEWTGYADLAAVAAAGGLERLVVEPSAGALDRINGTGKTFTIATRTGDTLTCEGRLYSVPWQGESALMLALIRTAADERLRDTEIALRAAEAETRELRSILDTATDGVIVVDRDGPHARAQPLGRGAVRLRVPRDRAPPVHRAVRAGERARSRATISTG